MNSIQYRSEYGCLHVGKYDGKWRRDVWVSARTGERFCEPALADGHKDQTDIQRQYDCQCSACYLNITHTTAAHQKRVSE
jgi:hypothetical protein